MLTSIKTFLQNPIVKSELHSAFVTFFTIFVAMLSTSIGSGNVSKEALISACIAAVRSAIKAVYQKLVSDYSAKQS